MRCPRLVYQGDTHTRDARRFVGHAHTTVDSHTLAHIYQPATFSARRSGARTCSRSRAPARPRYVCMCTWKGCRDGCRSMDGRIRPPCVCLRTNGWKSERGGLRVWVFVRYSSSLTTHVLSMSMGHKCRSQQTPSYTRSRAPTPRHGALLPPACQSKCMHDGVGGAICFASAVPTDHRPPPPAM